MRNMKIPVENKLDEIVLELKRLGYKPLNHLSCRSCHEWVVADCDGVILGWIDASGLDDRYYKTTTLDELKEM